jgi:CO/xanthine dehydrogenase FAD-binding subunit
MAAPDSQVYLPLNLAELLAYKDRFPESLLYAGGTGILAEDGSPYPALPYRVIALCRVAELSAMSRTERYLELGSMVRLSSLLEMGEKTTPPSLLSACARVANPSIRALATIGGNVMQGARCMGLSASLLALDTKFELRSLRSGSRWLSLGRMRGEEAPREDEVLVRLRIPYAQWDIELSRFVGSPSFPDESSAGFCFLASVQKESLADIRIAFAGSGIVRDRETENLLVGKRLPLASRDILSVVDEYRDSDSVLGLSPSLRAQFLALVEWALRQLS